MQDDRATVLVESFEIPASENTSAPFDDAHYYGPITRKQFMPINEGARRNVATTASQPIRAPQNLRATVRFDYQQGICRDRKKPASAALATAASSYMTVETTRRAGSLRLTGLVAWLRDAATCKRASISTS